MKHITREEAMKMLELPGFYRKACSIKRPRFPKHAVATYLEVYKYGNGNGVITMAVCSKSISELYEL